MPRERREVNDLMAITFDFGNTLVPFPPGPPADILYLTARDMAPALRVDPADFVRAWDEERTRQFTLDVPAGREADFDVRATRVLARLRGCPAPPPGEDWEKDRAEEMADPAQVAAVLDCHSRHFVAGTPVPSGVGSMLERLAGRYRLGLISNWPHAPAIEMFVEAAGWSRHFRAIVVSQRVGAIKPDRRIFDAAAREIGLAPGPAYLHVGDDLGADVLGAHGAGWRAALVRGAPAGSPLPVAPPAPNEVPDLVIDSVFDLEVALRLRARGAAS